MDASRSTEIPFKRHPDLLTLWAIMSDYMKPYAGMISQELILLQAIVDRLSAANEKDNLDAPSLKALADSVEFLQKRASELGLKMSVMKAAFLGHCVRNSVNALDLRVRTRDLVETMTHELFSVQFLPIPERCVQYTRPEAFGSEVHQKFHSARFDIAEAGMCFACGRWTGAVMHCMRVLEFGLDALGKELKVQRGHRGWGQDLKNFSSAWDGRVKNWKKGDPPLAWRREFFPKVFSQFEYFENAWRNHAMHAHANYGELEASRVFEHVMAFMQLLSARLREPKNNRLKKSP
jgi:hypothetical protein